MYNKVFELLKIKASKRPFLVANPEDIDFFKAYFDYSKNIDFIPLKGFQRFHAKFFGKENIYLVPQQLLPFK